MSEIETLEIGNPLHTHGKLWGRIRFEHTDGKEHEFWSYENSLTESRLSAFDSDPPTIGEMAWVRSVFRDIWLKAPKVLGWGGQLATPPDEKTVL